MESEAPRLNLTTVPGSNVSSMAAESVTLPLR